MALSVSSSRSAFSAVRTQVLTVPSGCFIRSAISVDDQPIEITLRPPTFGEHTDEVLRDLLHFGEAEIAALREAKAIR